MTDIIKIPDNLAELNLPNLRAVYASKIKKYFNHPKEREFFSEISALTYNAILNGYENIFLELPVGQGKSSYTKTIGEALLKNDKIDSFFVLTNKIGLMEQYETEPGEKLTTLKGRQNFHCRGEEICTHCPDATNLNAPCVQNKSTCTVDFAPCRYSRFKCKERTAGKQAFEELNIEGITGQEISTNCEYVNQFYTAALSRRVLTNPAYLFTLQSGVRKTPFEKRDIAFYDEAHNLFDVITEIAKKVINLREWNYCFESQKFPEDADQQTWKQRITKMYSIVSERLKVVSKTIKTIMTNNSNSKENELIKEENMLTDLKDKLGFLYAMLESTYTKITIGYTQAKQNPYAVFVPVSIAGIAKFILNKTSEQRVFLSASFRDPMFWISTFGMLKSKNLFIICEESSFPVENRLIVYEPSGSMSYKSQDKNIGKMVKNIEDILDKHKNQRGLILPYSYALSDKIMANISNNHKKRIIYHTKIKTDREEAIQEFMKDTSNNSVIISPYLNEGFDGKGDIARFLVLCKMPYPSMNDELVKERIIHEQQRLIENIDCNYAPDNRGICVNYACNQVCYRSYNLMTAITLIQMAGRIVRSKEDWGTIYILDQAFKRFFNRNKELFPKYMIEAIQGM